MAILVYQKKLLGSKRTPLSFLCAYLILGRYGEVQSYLRAVLASDGVAVLWVLDKGHIHTHQGSPIHGHYLASDQRHQAERESGKKKQHWCVRHAEGDRDKSLV